MFWVTLVLPASAYEVPTVKQNKNILLEEFTGIHCGYCPQGHAIANNLLVAQPECTYVISIHSGDYSYPKPDEPDFRTEDGDAINQTIGSEFYRAGYPSGMINRHTFTGDMRITGREQWTKGGKSIHQEIAPVNLLMKSSFDGNTRILTVSVEGYYTENMEKDFNLLNVALTQSNIKGPQNGGAMGSDYIHNYMLRGYITPTWGDTIKTPRQGDYFIRNYTYALPASINETEVKAENIELIAFVCADKTEVLNVTGGKPVYINYEKALNAKILPADREVKGNYGYNFFEAKLKNESDQTITSAEFEVTVNGNTQNASWNGNINSFETAPVTIKVMPYDIASQNEFIIKLTKVNEQSLAGNSIEGRFNAPIECTPQIGVELQTDLYADENMFAIKDTDGNIIKEFGPYPANNNTIYKGNTSLEQGKIYCFEITDTWGDGMQDPRGYYKLFNQESQSMITQQYDIRLHGHRFFFNTTLTSEIQNLMYGTGTAVTSHPEYLELIFIPASSGRAMIELYSSAGKKIETYTVCTNANEISIRNISTSTLPKGIYFIKIQENNRSQTVKVIIR